MKIIVFKAIEAESKIFGVRLSDLFKILLSTILLFCMYLFGSTLLGLSEKFLIIVFIVPAVLYIYFRFFSKGKDVFFLEKKASGLMGKRIIKARSFSIPDK